MAKQQRLVISDLHQIGLVDEVDSINLKENALTTCRNLKPRKGRLASASKIGALVSNTPIFSGANYRTARIWKTYGSSSKQLALLGSEYFEYCDEDGNRSAIPHWMGIFGKTETNGVIAGNKVGSAYSIGDAFSSNIGSKLTTSDRVFLSELTAGDSIVDAHFTKADGALPAGWTVEYGSMAVASNAATSSTLSWATNSALSASAQDNWLATIRYCTFLETNSGACAIYVRDSATKRGYIIDVSYELTETDYGGPDEYVMRFYAGYINDATNIFANSLLIQNDVVETSATADWTNYKDMWMWYRKPFITWGYGKQVMGTMPVEFTFGTLECGIVTSYAAIGPKQGSTHNPVMFWKLTDRGPYTPSAMSYTSNNATLTGVTTSMYGLAWGAKACDEDTHHIRTTNEYAMRLASDLPLLIWKGGMLPEYCPNIGQPTAEGFGTYVYWTGNDVAAFNGHLCLVGAKILVYLLNPNLGYYEFFPVLSYPTRMMYAVANDPDDWSTSEGAGYIEFIDTPGEAVAIWPLRDTLMVYKADATIQLSPTGLSTDPFRVAYFDMSIGADGAKTVVDAGKFHFFGRNEALYTVSTGDLSIVPTASTLYNYRNAHRWNHDNTVIFGQYNSTDDAFVGRGYNYKTGSMYELFLSDIVALDSANNYACALTHAGAVYGYSGQDIENATSFNPYSTSEYFETPQLTMGTIQYNKTVYCVDVYVRSTYTGTYSPIVKLIYTVNGTAAGELTVTSESVGNGIYRARFTFKANGIYFKFRVTSGDAANRIGFIEYVRVEVDYTSDEPDQRMTAT